MDALSLDTPALYVDLDAMERNIDRMQALCRGFGVGLRPHTKTHKIPEIAQRQLAAGALGLTVAKLGEAEVMPDSDLLIAYPLMPEKWPRLRALAAQRRVIVVVDDAATATGAAAAGARVLVEVDVGAGRCGVQTPADAVAVARAAGAAFAGLFYWPSWLDENGFRRACALVDESLAALAAAGQPADIVSGGSTPGVDKTPLIPRTTEIRPGTYVFFDGSSLRNGLCAESDCALRVLTTVVSTRVPGQWIIDAGSKTLSSDATVGAGTFGELPAYAVSVTRLNEEHGYVGAGGPRAPSPGDKLWLIPAHVCSTVNLHDEIWFGRGGQVDGAWKVAARGKVR